MHREFEVRDGPQRRDAKERQETEVLRAVHDEHKL